MKLVTSSFLENFKMAIDTLRGSKLRSFLTIFGVVIGVVTVMVISSMISGIKIAVEKQVESFGTRSIFLYKQDIGIRTSAPTREERMRKPLTMEDADAVSRLSTIELAVPYLDISNNFFGQKINVTGKNGKTSSSVQLNGTMPDAEKAPGEVLVEGRWFSQSENETKANVCIIGDSVKEAYFTYQSPVGETLEIGGTEFRVIGLLEKREQLFGGGGGNNDQSNTIYMPMGAALKLKPNADDLFVLAIAREGQLEKAKDDVQDLLRVRRQVPFGEKNNFAMETAASIIDQFAAISNGVFIAMIVISSVGLMIGGIGVMNIMLVSVTERTREIGIRKAIGAKQKDILLQFLIEAATLTGFGGLVGLLVGWLISLLIRLVFPSYVPWWAPPMGFGASVLIGLVFGLFPAWKAARLDPIESLRYE
ncbi:MAG: ABC transporter permease [Pyrinomonadaceae bacterium]|nr:ABC transporter permease [Pyrinomonadaceae bacterium]MBP6213556.1 ABC transporter permease [Pyrinomonadaceae bacterium]